MLGRLAFLTYGVVCYLVFLATFLWAIAWVGGIGVAHALDAPASGRRPRQSPSTPPCSPSSPRSTA